MRTIGYALRMAEKFYDKNTYDHVINVGIYISENNMIPGNIRNKCIALAIMHDLIEDTEYTYEDMKKKGFSEHFIKCIELLTKPKEMNYTDYIKKIKANREEYPEAWWVKLMDMKDHLSRTETLTDKLKEKYLAALPHLL